MIYDLDDWVPGFPKYSGASIDAGKLKRFEQHLEYASIVTVSNTALLQKVQTIHPRVALVPNGFFVEKYISFYPGGLVRHKKIAFSNADNLKLVKFKQDFIRVLNDLVEKHEDWDIDFYGDPFPEMTEIKRLRNMGSLAYEEHKRCLVSCGYAFAIVPLGGYEDPENLEFNSCKNPFKYLEYGGLGIPAIFSRSPIFDGTVKHQETGWIIDNTKEEWHAALETFVSDAQLRERVALAAFRDVVTNHHVKVPASKFLELIQRELGCQEGR